MCMSACSSSTAPNVGTDTASSTTSYAPAIGGDAETGVAAIRLDTGYDPADPVQDQAPSLAAQLQQAQGLLNGGATGVAEPAAPGAFAAALQERSPIQLQPMSDGRAMVANLDSIVQARQQRVARLEEAFLADPAATPVDQARMDQERALLTSTETLRDKLTTLAETIDANEAAAVMRLVGDANQQGEYRPEQLAEVMIQIEGSAHNLPASYLELAMRAQELLEQSRQDIEEMTRLIAEAADKAGVIDQAALVELEEMSANQHAAHEALRANFEFAKQDPQAAQAQLQVLAA